MNWVDENGLGGSANQLRDGFYLSVGVRDRVHRRLSLVVDLQYASKGFNRTTPTVHSSFLEMPVLALWELSSQARPTQFFLGAGVAPAVMLRCVRFYVGINGPHEDSCGESSDGGNQMEAFRHWDVSQEWRVGVRRGVGAGRLVGLLRVSSSLLDQQPGAASEGVSTRNFVTGWSLGYERAFR